jgi:hypothetical protein
MKNGVFCVLDHAAPPYLGFGDINRFYSWLLKYILDPT